MNEIVTTTTSSPVSAYAEMTKDALIDGIRKEACKARTKGNEMVDCMERIGHLLIELKTRVDYGNFMDQAERMTGLPQRSINRYMAIARDPDGFRNRRRGIPAEEVITLTKKAPSWFDRIERETKVDTVSIPSAVEPPSPPPSRSAVIDVEAEIVVHSQKVETPDEMFQRGLDSLQESMPPVEFVDLLETALAKNPEAERAEEPPAPAVAAPTASAAPSVIETSETTLAQILGLLPRLRPVELKELVTVINTRWLNHPAPAPVDHLAACWKSATPEQRAAFLETCHLIEKP
jgi:hypothetical protein